MDGGQPWYEVLRTSIILLGDIHQAWSSRVNVVRHTCTYLVMSLFSVEASASFLLSSTSYYPGSDHPSGRQAFRSRIPRRIFIDVLLKNSEPKKALFPARPGPWDVSNLMRTIED